MNDTIANNTAGNAGNGGGGILGGGPAGAAGTGGGVGVSSGTLNTRNTIVALNTAASGLDVFGAFISLGHNFIGKADGSSGFTNGSNGDQAGTIASPINPLLGPLQNNGGSTQTLRPAANSPVVNAGDSCVVNQSCSPQDIGFNLTTDQRGLPRNAQGAVDIGYVEISSLSVTIDQATGQLDPTNSQPINFTAVFGSPVTGFTSSGISLGRIDSKCISRVYRYYRQRHNL